MNLSPNEIAALIFFQGDFGPKQGFTFGTSGQLGDNQAEQFLDIAIAVCLSESGGSTDVKNGSSSATGLWQVLAVLHADLVKGILNEAAKDSQGNDIFKPRYQNLTNPVVNTTAAKKLYNSAGGWSPWEAYNTGAYKKHLGHGKEARAFLSKQENLKAVQAKMWDIYYTPAAVRWHNALSNGSIGKISDPNFIDILQGAAGDAGGKLASLNPASWVPGLVSSILESVKGFGIRVGIFIIGIIIVGLGLWFTIGSSVPTPTKIVKKAVA